MNSNISNHQKETSNDQDKNEKYRLLTEILENKCSQISKSNEKIATRWEE